MLLYDKFSANCNLEPIVNYYFTMQEVQRYERRCFIIRNMTLSFRSKTDKMK